MADRFHAPRRRKLGRKHSCRQAAKSNSTVDDIIRDLAPPVNGLEIMSSWRHALGLLKKKATGRNISGVILDLDILRSCQPIIRASSEGDNTGRPSYATQLNKFGYRVGALGSPEEANSWRHEFNEVIVVESDNVKLEASLYRSLAERLSVPLSQVLIILDESLQDDNGGRYQDLICNHLGATLAWLPGVDLDKATISQEDGFTGPVLDDIADRLEGHSNPLVLRFGPHRIRSSEVFLETKYCLGLVNLKPIAPGHVLIVSRRLVRRFADLHSSEVEEMWRLAHKVGAVIEKHYKAQSLTFAIQDGPAAGQTVPHVHIHIVPRKIGDFEDNDQVYEEIDKTNFTEKPPTKGLDAPQERRARSLEEMSAEATVLRQLFGPPA